MIEIKFCENNFSFGTEETADRLAQTYSQIRVDIEPCLGYCGECAAGPYAIVNEELIQADSPDELYQAIAEIIEQGR